LRGVIDITESSHERVTIPPLQLVDVMTFDPVDREAYWSGPEGEIAVLTRIGVPLDTPAGSGIHTIIVDLNDASRDQWKASAGMDDDALEAFEQRAILEDQRREKEAQAERERAAMDAIRNQREPLPTAPANAYEPVPVERD
jgi:hypothetical protein